MKGLAITSKGIEDIAVLEVKELINSKAEIKDSCITFTIKKLEDLCLLCYKAQSVDKILFLLDTFELKDLGKQIAKIKFDKWLDKTTTFRVSCKLLKSKISKGLGNSKNFQSKLNNEDISSEEISGKIGALIIDNIKKNKKYKQKVELDNPDITFLIFINKNTAYFGIDFSGRDLHKREYKLFAHPASLRSTIAYSLLRIADLKQKEILLDPFCHSGEIPIEAALFTTNFPVNYYSKEKFAFKGFKPFKKTNFEKFFKDIDKKIIKAKSQKSKISEGLGNSKNFQSKPSINCFDPKVTNLNAAKKNAKIAGIHKLISYSRIDTENLDIKQKKASIDKIVTHPPDLTRITNPKDIEKTHNEFFYQAEFILKKKGKVVTITRSPDLLKAAAEKYKFKVEKEREIYSGKQPFKVITFSK